MITKHKNLFKLLLSILISVTISLLISLLIATINYCKNNNYSSNTNIELKNIKTDYYNKHDNTIVIPREGGFFTICFNKYTYVNKLEINYSCKDQVDSTINYNKINIFGINSKEDNLINDYYSPLLNRSVINIFSKTNNININIGNSNSKCIIKKIRIINGFNWNCYLFIVLLFLTFGLSNLILSREFLKNKPQIIAVIIILCSGLSIIFTQTPTLSGWDEQIHLKNAYNLAYTSGKNHNSFYILEDNYTNFLFHKNQSIEEHNDLIILLNNNSFKNKSRSIKAQFSYIDVGYIPQAIGLSIGCIFNLKFYNLMLFSKVFGLLFYALCIYISISIIPIFKRLAILLSVLPTSIFLICQFTYDFWITGLLFIAFSIWLNLLYNKEKEVNIKDIIAFSLIVILASLPKIVYLPLLLLIFIIPKSRFKEEKNSKLVKTIFICFLLIVFLVILIKYLNMPSNIGDIRGGNDVSIHKQLFSILLKKPFSFAIVLFKNIFVSLFDFVFMINNNFNGNEFQFYLYNAVFCPTAYALFVVVVLFTDRQYNMSEIKNIKLIKTILTLVIFSIIALIWIALYLHFNNVGSEIIYGVQARYYIPLLLPIGTIFYSTKINNTYSIANYHVAVFGLYMILLFIDIIRSFVYYTCM